MLLGCHHFPCRRNVLAVCFRSVMHSIPSRFEFFISLIYLKYLEYHVVLTPAALNHFYFPFPFKPLAKMRPILWPFPSVRNAIDRISLLHGRRCEHTQPFLLCPFPLPILAITCNVWFRRFRSQALLGQASMLPETDNLVREDGSGSGNENTAGGGPDDEDGWDGSGGSGDSDGTDTGNLLIQTSGGCRALDASRPFIAKNASLEISIIDGFIRDRHAENLFLSRHKKVCWTVQKSKECSHWRVQFTDKWPWALGEHFCRSN